MNRTAIHRIHHRLALERGGALEATGDLRFRVSLPEDLDTDDSRAVVFQNELAVEDEQLTLRCDADLGKLSPAQAALIAEFQRDFAAALKREGVAFDAFTEVAAFLEEEAGAAVEEGTIIIGEEDEETGEVPVFVNEVSVAHEPWVNLSIAFVDDVNPEWLLEQNGLLTHVHFETFEGEVSLATAQPLVALTGQRLLELISDLISLRDHLLDELEGGDEDEGEDEGEEDDEEKEG